MTTPMTYASLPAHRSLDLSLEARADLPVVEWLAYTAPQYQHLKSTNTLGEWFIGHPRDTTSGCDPVDISYQMPMAEGETYQSVMATKKSNDLDSHEAWEAWAKISKQEIGFAWNQDYAMLFVEKALRQPPGLDPEKILLDAGFVFAHEIHGNSPGKPATRVFNKQDEKRGYFTAMVSSHSLWLTHEKRGSNSWENLLAVHACKEGASGQVIPNFISPQVANIVAAAAEMSVYFVQNWKPQPNRARAKRRSP